VMVVVVVVVVVVARQDAVDVHSLVERLVVPIRDARGWSRDVLKHHPRHALAGEKSRVHHVEPPFGDVEHPPAIILSSKC
jgi:hypothetical protein